MYGDDLYIHSWNVADGNQEMSDKTDNNDDEDNWSDYGSDWDDSDSDSDNSSKVDDYGSVLFVLNLRTLQWNEINRMKKIVQTYGTYRHFTRLPYEK